MKTSTALTKNRVTIEIKSGNSPWRVIDEHPSIRGGVYTWTGSNVAPCKNHQVRIWVHGKDQSQSSFQFPKTIAVVSQNALASSGYQPQKPKFLKIVQTVDYVVLSWSPSLCADLYDFTYQKVTGGETFSRQVPATERPSLTISDGIESCSEYEVKVVAVTSEEYSDDTFDTFSGFNNEKRKRF